jgi:hypothetical protein
VENNASETYDPAVDGVLETEYMRACLRLKTGGTGLDCLSGEDLRSTWTCMGRPAVSYGEWASAMLGSGDRDPGQAPPVKGPQPSGEEIERVNKEAIEGILAMRANAEAESKKKPEGQGTKEGETRGETPKV